jgi:hypothetical protein
MGWLLSNRSGAPVPLPNRSACSFSQPLVHTTPHRASNCALSQLKRSDRKGQSSRLYRQFRPVNGRMSAPAKHRNPIGFWSVLGCTIFSPTVWTAMRHLCAARDAAQSIL